MTGEQQRVLVVSSAASVQKNITISLQGSGYDIGPIATEAGCVDALAGPSPALVLVSLFDDAIDAARLLAAIRAVDARLPVVLMADADTAAGLVPLLQGGADDYLLYPLAAPALVQYILSRNIDQPGGTGRQTSDEADLQRRMAALQANLELLEQDQRAGLRVQQGMLPESPRSVGRLRFEHRMVPSLILSGDFVDYCELPDGRLLFYIADVSGHGTSGAMVTILLKRLGTRLCSELGTLGLDHAGQMLGWFNRELLACGLPQHVTLFLGMIDTDGESLEYANAAHFPPPILSSAGSARYLETGGLPLGIYDKAEYSCRKLALPTQFTLVMFSDGVLEILAEASLKEKEDKLLSLVEYGGGSIADLVDRLGLGEVRQVPDDIAVFTVARAG